MRGIITEYFFGFAYHYILRADSGGTNRQLHVRWITRTSRNLKTADFTLSRTPRGHRTGCPPDYRRVMVVRGGGRVRVSFKQQGNKRVRGVKHSLPQSILWSIRINVAPGNFIRPKGTGKGWAYHRVRSSITKCTSDLAVLFVGPRGKLDMQ
jgi:hypothetical protein